MPVTKCVFFVLFASPLFPWLSSERFLNQSRPFCISLTDMFPVHVVIKAEAVNWRVGDAVRIFRCHVEGGAQQTGFVAVFTGSGGLNVHVETCR